MQTIIKWREKKRHQTNAKRSLYFNLICFRVCIINDKAKKKRVSNRKWLISRSWAILSTKQKTQKREKKTQKPKSQYFAQTTKRIATDKRRTLSFCEFIDKNNITIMRAIIMETPIKNHNNGNYVFHIE